MSSMSTPYTRVCEHQGSTIDKNYPSAGVYNARPKYLPGRGGGQEFRRLCKIFAWLPFSLRILQPHPHPHPRLRPCYKLWIRVPVVLENFIL